MHYTRLGTTGLEVSRLCLGCMSYGDPGKGNHSWVLDEEQSRPILRQALDSGITFFDTANTYSLGESEAVLGRALWSMTRRENVVIATKVFGRMRPGPNGGGLSRKAILFEIDQSLSRLGTDYVDLYQIHRFDPETPVEETLEALDDVVKAGKARYIGASSMAAWQFMKMLGTQQQLGLARFVSMQNHLNLIHREEEREMLPLCTSEGIGVLPWSPLARGRLTRPWSASSARLERDAVGKNLYAGTETRAKAIVDILHALAGNRGVPPARIALAWVLQKRPVSAPIVGVTRGAQLDDAVAALDILLTPEEIDALEAPEALAETKQGDQR